MFQLKITNKVIRKLEEIYDFIKWETDYHKFVSIKRNKLTGKILLTIKNGTKGLYSQDDLHTNIQNNVIQKEKNTRKLKKNSVDSKNYSSQKNLTKASKPMINFSYFQKKCSGDNTSIEFDEAMTNLRDNMPKKKLIF